jgi:hypothetical protein
MGSRIGRIGARVVRELSENRQGFVGSLGACREGGRQVAGDGYWERHLETWLSIEIKRVIPLRAGSRLSTTDLFAGFFGPHAIDPRIQKAYPMKPILSLDLGQLFAGNTARLSPRIGRRGNTSVERCHRQ